MSIFNTIENYLSSYNRDIPNDWQKKAVTGMFIGTNISILSRYVNSNRMTSSDFQTGLKAGLFLAMANTINAFVTPLVSRITSGLMSRKVSDGVNHGFSAALALTASLYVAKAIGYSDMTILTQYLFIIGVNTVAKHIINDNIEGVIGLTYL